MSHQPIAPALYPGLSHEDGVFDSTITYITSNELEESYTSDSLIKSSADATIAPVEESTHSSLLRNWKQSKQYAASWRARRPTWIQLRPLAGIFALLVTFSCAFTSLAILICSADQPTARWPIQPTVYLAIASAIANSALGVAHLYAIPISWWYQASKGSTISALESQWNAGNSLTSAIIHCRSAGWTAAATIFTALMIIDGPLLQRTSTVIIATQSRPVFLNMLMAPESPAASTIRDEYKDGKPILLSADHGCDGTCTTQTLAPGFWNTHCDIPTWPVTRDMLFDANATWGPWGGALASFMYNTGVSNPLFYVNLDAYSDTPLPGVFSQDVALVTGSLLISNYSGQFMQKNCTFAPAILAYDVQLSSLNQVSIVRPDTGPSGRFVAFANNTRPPSDDVDPSVKQPDTTDCLAYDMSDFVSSNASMGAPLWPNEEWEPNLESYNAVTRKYSGTNTDSDADFTDPTADINSDLNELMFRAGVYSAAWPDVTALMDEGLSPNQTVSANQTVTHNVFHSDLRWYAVATMLELLAISILLPKYWGWWRVGSQLSLSPFSIASAFDAPLLQAANSPRDVVEKLGDTHVQYGTVFKDERAVSRVTRISGGEGEKYTQVGHFVQR